MKASNQLKGAMQNVTTAGTRIQLPAFRCEEVTVIAKKGNTGSIFVGDITVSAANYGVELEQKESHTFAVTNTNLIYIDAEVSGEGVSYVAL